MSVGVGTALLIGGISAAGSIGSAAIGAHAANKAAETQAKAADVAGNLAVDAAKTGKEGYDTATEKANELLKGLPDDVRKQLEPYLNLGTSSTMQLSDLLKPGSTLDKNFSFAPTDLKNTPGYQFTLQQGQEAINRAAASQGKNLGGGTLKALLGYGEGLASKTYGEEFQRALDTFNTNRQSTQMRLNALMDTTRLGAGASEDLAGIVSGSTTARANNLTNDAQYGGNLGIEAARIAGGAKTDAAAAQAAGTVGAANAWTGGISGGINAANGYLTMKNLMMPNSLQSPGSIAPPGYNPGAYPPTSPGAAPRVNPVYAPPVSAAPSGFNPNDPYTYDPFKTYGAGV